MITVEKKYEAIVNEQPFSSHIYENQSELLQGYYTRPIRNDVSVEQNVTEINTVVKNEKQRSSTNHTFQNIRPQSTNDDTVIAEQSDYIWDPEWSHPLFLNIPIDVSSQSISTISIHKDYVKVFLLTIDATLLN